MPDLTDMLAAGLTYRELDYWTRNGYLHAEDPAPGSGYNRTWAAGEAGVARRMARLRRAGIPLPVAHDIARGNPQIAPRRPRALRPATRLPHLHRTHTRPAVGGSSMNPIAATVLFLLALGGLLTTGLWALAGWARRQHATPPAESGPRQPIPALAGQGYLTDAEAEAAAAAAADIARLNAVGRILHRQLARVEREARAALGVTAADLVNNRDALWARLRTGEFELAAVA